MNQVGPDRDDTCPRCGDPVVAFNVDLFSQPMRLEPRDVPVTADLVALHREFRLWHHLGPRLGWSPKYTADRDWRPLRVTHRCADQQENKSKKENIA